LIYRNRFSILAVSRAVGKIADHSKIETLHYNGSGEDHAPPARRKPVKSMTMMEQGAF
jgi:hypothetical protein